MRCFLHVLPIGHGVGVKWAPEGLVGERHNGHLMIEQAWCFAENKEQERRLTPVGVVVLNMRGCGGGFVVAKVKPPKSLFCQTIHEMSGLFLMVDK